MSQKKVEHEKKNRQCNTKIYDSSDFYSHLFLYGTVIAGGLAISKNLSLESADIQAFVMERLPIVWDF